MKTNHYWLMPMLKQQTDDFTIIKMTDKLKKIDINKTQSKRIYSTLEVAELCLKTFGKTLEEMGLCEFKKRNTIEKYQMYCLTYYLYRNQLGATYQSVGEQIGRSDTYAMIAVRYIEQYKANEKQ